MEGFRYDENYYMNNCGPNAYDSQSTISFFEKVAENIIKDFNPKTVLDVGCAMGHLVYALRVRNVEAYGIDISEYGISRVRSEIKHYCRVGSILDELPVDFPKRFDLLVTIEVAEHLYEEDGKLFIEKICRYSDKIIFSSTSNDFSEKTHYNVQQPEYWAKIFAKQGFFRRISNDPNYVLPQSVVYYKTSVVYRVIEDYERSVRFLHQDLIKLKNDFLVLKDDRSKAQSIMDSQLQKIEQQRKEYVALLEDRSKAQEIMDNQSQVIERQNKEHVALLEDRSKAQEIMDNQLQIIEWQKKKFNDLLDDKKKTQEIIYAQIHFIEELNEEIRQLINSNSWKITKPLRFLFNIIRRISK